MRCKKTRVTMLSNQCGEYLISPFLFLTINLMRSPISRNYNAARGVASTITLQITD
jgi:hypothetical protein